MKKFNISIGIVGLGYVGLPLFLEFNKKYKSAGFDLSKKRVSDLKKYHDYNNDIEILKNKKYKFTNKIKDLSEVNFFIITVPTPLKKNNNPDLSKLKTSCKNIASVLKRGDIVVFESTVYPGVTQEICIPILERYSKLKLNYDFSVGYSPERISPGDSKHKLINIKKVISASNQKALKTIKKVYKSIVKAGVFEAKNIKTAEASKIVENVQRDLNISLMNEFSFLFSKMKIDTHEVLNAAKTKWNFLDFKPGLVGGHCIRVDPYYLTYKSKKMGYNAKVISSGRKVNERIPKFIVKNILNILKKKKLKKEKIKIRILGVTFKENCADLRNSQVIEIINLLKRYKINVSFYDPMIISKNLPKNLKNIYKKNISNDYDVLIIAVAHKEYKKLNLNKIKKILGKKEKIIFDLKGLLNKDYYQKNKFTYWRL